MTPLAKIILGVVALALGVLLGIPGRGAHRARRPPRRGRWRRRNRDTGVHDEKRIAELEHALGRVARRSGSPKRYFTPLDLLRREKRASQRRRTRRYFKTAAPSRHGKRGR